LDPASILDATVVLTIKRFAKEDAIKNRKILQSVLDAVKSEDTTIKDHSGKIIKEDAIKEYKEISIHYINKDFPDEAQLETEMRQYLNEV